MAFSLGYTALCVPCLHDLSVWFFGHCLVGLVRAAHALEELGGSFGNVVFGRLFRESEIWACEAVADLVTVL